MSVKIEGKHTWHLNTQPPLIVVKEKLEGILNSLQNFPSAVRVENMCTDECCVSFQIENSVAVIRITPNPDHFKL